MSLSESFDSMEYFKKSLFFNGNYAENGDDVVYLIRYLVIFNEKYKVTLNNTLLTHINQNVAVLDNKHLFKLIMGEIKTIIHHIEKEDFIEYLKMLFVDEIIYLPDCENILRIFDSINESLVKNLPNHKIFKAVFSNPSYLNELNETI